MIRRALVLVAVVLGVFSIAPAAHAQYQPGQPGLALIPSTVSPGEQVQAQGFGCARNAPVTIAINGAPVATTTAGDNPEGSFQATFTAPSTPGFYDVTSTCGDTVVHATLEVAAATQAPSNALPTTGSGLAIPLARIGIALIAVGGFVVLAVRQRRTRV